MSGTVKHRALIIGAGRIGAGFNWINTPYVYTHADTYLAMKERVELVGFVEPDKERANAASKKYRVPTLRSVKDAIKTLNPNVISICTQPDKRSDLYWEVLGASTGTPAFDGPYGWWVEKPWTSTDFTATFPIQVNYMRRGERVHRALAGVGKGKLTVWAKRDAHTVCHFTDLARFWGLERSQLIYNPIDGPNFYEWEYATATPLNPNTKIRFEGGGLTDGFMERMCGNLLDAMDYQTGLISPINSAIESERWANEILGA